MKCLGNLKKVMTAAVAATMLMMVGCGNSSSNKKNNEPTTAAGQSGNTIIITLNAEQAPITCENFEKLVKEGFYDGLTFHRVIDGFMAQGGDPEGTGMGGSKNTIKGEFKANGVNNELSHQRGVISMARAQDYDSASSQFFICYTGNYTADLDGYYAAFGNVTEGMEVVEDFTRVPRTQGGDGNMSKPTTPIVMEKVEMIEPDANGWHRVKITMNNFLE
ncbi:peptidylprolyl isomerase [Ruminococcus sp.]|uniref:peptidylprolyl isomerase n=1 Tax=Ruminococcus sp. TaxID=41978 RepID=UPI0025E0860A|nr:peptidylprolyl isomerase [Ruminococcus sp.]